MSIPSRRATDERTWSASSFSPSISLLFKHVFGERAENGLLSDPEAERLHLADQAPLQVPGCGQRGRQPSVIPTELGPVRKLMDIVSHSPHVLR